MDVLAGLQMDAHNEQKLRALISRYLQAEQIVYTKMANALSAAAEYPLTTAKAQYLALGPLHVQTGRLRASVTKRPPFGAQKISGKKYSVSVGSPVWYGRFWELGFHRSGKFFPPKKWLEPAFKDNMQRIKATLEKVASNATEVT